MFSLTRFPDMPGTFVTGDSILRRWTNMQPALPNPPRPPRIATTMSTPLLLFLIGVTWITSSIPGAIAQSANITCKVGYEWMTNSKGQNPCLVSSWLNTPCSSPYNSVISPLTPDTHYTPPYNNSESATPCRCNTVLFSTLAACATCQGEATGVLPWLMWSQNCSATYLQTYPENIPSGTAVPAWAYLDIRVNGTFSADAAQALAGENLPESTGQPAPTQTSSSDTSSGSKKSNVGAIVGGVVGGIAGLALIGVAAFLFLRSRRTRSSASGGTHDQPEPMSPPPPGYYTGTQTWEKAPVTSVSTHKPYDPNDPSTFPAQGPYASSGAVGSHTNINNRGPYRGAPEL